MIPEGVLEKELLIAMLTFCICVNTKSCRNHEKKSANLKSSSNSTIISKSNLLSFHSDRITRVMKERLNFLSQISSRVKQKVNRFAEQACHCRCHESNLPNTFEQMLFSYKSS